MHNPFKLIHLYRINMKHFLTFFIFGFIFNVSLSQNNGDVLLQSGVGILIENGATVTIEGNLELESNATSFSSVVTKGTINVQGVSKYNRFVNSNENRNDLVAPPMANQTWLSFLSSDFGYNANNVYNNGNTISPTYLFGPFEKGNTDDYIVYDSNDNVTLNSGMGYRAATNTPLANGNGTTLIFTGSVLETALLVPILNETSGGFKEWNLVGNPYPAYLDVNAFLNHQITPGITNLSVLNANSAAIYGYDADNTDLSGSYWTITNLLEGPNVIAPGQGFFVSSENAMSNIEFTPDMMVMSTSDDFIANRSTQSFYLKLRASDANNSALTSIYFNANTTLGLDVGYDASLFGDAISDFALYSHLVEENAGYPMTIQAFSNSNLNEVVVPLGCHASEGTQITFELFEANLPSDLYVYLEDTLLNTLTLLNTDNYNVSATEDLNGTGRFYLRFSNETLNATNETVDTIQIYTLQNQNLLKIDGELKPNTTAHIIDLQGRITATLRLDYRNTTQSIDVSHLSTGIYIVKLNSNGYIKTQKIIIN